MPLEQHHGPDYARHFGRMQVSKFEITYLRREYLANGDLKREKECQTRGQQGARPLGRDVAGEKRWSWPACVQMVGEAEQEVAGVRQTHMSFEWSDGTGESDFNELLGKLVRITGLTGRPELNGRLGAPRSPTPHLHLHPHNACTKVLRASSRTEVRFPHACRGMRWLAMYSWHTAARSSIPSKATVPPHPLCRPSI